MDVLVAQTVAGLAKVEIERSSTVIEVRRMTSQLPSHCPSVCPTAPQPQED